MKQFQFGDSIRHVLQCHSSHFDFFELCTITLAVARATFFLTENDELVKKGLGKTSKAAKEARKRIRKAKKGSLYIFFYLGQRRGSLWSWDCGQVFNGNTPLA